MTTPPSDRIPCEVLVIGRGMAGMAATLFAAKRGVSTVQVGMTGELIFASGVLDLMGVHPLHDRTSWHDPWAGIEALVRDIPDHPYARLKGEAIRAAFDEVLSFLEDQSLPYCRQDSLNSEILTPVGSIKETYCVPKTMWNGVQALREKRPTLLVNFQALHDFSARQVLSTMKDEWPQLRSVRISFPSPAHVKDLVTGEMTAQALELSKNREKLVKDLKRHLKDAQALGLPAILGMRHSHDIVSEFGEKIGIPVFEIPTLPLSIPGLRLHDAFTRGLLDKGVRIFSQYRILEVKQTSSGDFLVRIGKKTPKQTIKARVIILASGRFWGGGLRADRKRIHETIFDLPLYQPKERGEWHFSDFLDPRGHPINRAGIEIDEAFRPVNDSGHPLFQNLFAAGSLLAHQDWMRMKCGSGLAIATAYGAVNGFLRKK